MLTPAKFPEVNTLVAEGQDEYTTLPAFVGCTEAGVICITSCWQLTWRQRIKILFSGVLWHQMLTGGKPIQPQMLHIDKPLLYRPVKLHPKPTVFVEGVNDMIDPSELSELDDA